MAVVLRHCAAHGVPVWKQLSPNNIQRVPVPCMVAVSLDVDELINRLGEKALRSKGKRATAFNGALIVRVKAIAKSWT